jgi:asparagine synthase (glutamine-hydrolysing)
MADQPFASPDGKLWLVCNGEIYNHSTLRRRFPRYPYRSRSDVEVILPLYLNKGCGGLDQLDGMFALALWDARRRLLILARDRAGEKPLFYFRKGNEIVFASEVQALLSHPAAPRSLDDTAFRHYCTLGYVIEPRTMFAGIRKVEAGTIHVFQAGHHSVTRYWSPPVARETDLPDETVTAQLNELLEHAVVRQARADVPVGVFCSGGIDSSLIAAIAARRFGRDAVRLFTVGFADRSYDETAWAASLARRLGSPHTTVLVDESALADALAAIVGSVAEPLADPAALPTYLLARAARREVPVVLSGEGADELFGGYPTYLGHKWAPAFQALPPVARRGLRGLVRRLPVSAGKVPLEFLLKRFVDWADSDWLTRHTAWFGTSLTPTPGYLRSATRLGDTTYSEETQDVIASAMLLDYLTYLREGLLTKIDRTTMLCSLEARAPYLDRALTEFAFGLPVKRRLRSFTTKWALAQVALRWLPRRIVYRRKRGLSVPIARWLNGGLRTEVDRVLSPRRLRRTGLSHPATVGQLLAEHRSGRANHARALWTLFVFELWRERWLGD